MTPRCTPLARAAVLAALAALAVPAAAVSVIGNPAHFVWVGESDGKVNRKRIKALRLELQQKGWKSIGY